MIELERPLAFVVYNPTFIEKKVVLFGKNEMQFKTHFGSDSLVRILFHGTDIQDYGKLIRDVSNGFSKITVASRNKQQVEQKLKLTYTDANAIEFSNNIEPIAKSNSVEFTFDYDTSIIIDQNTKFEFVILPRTEVRISFEPKLSEDVK